ncbi:MAG: ADP-ribose pyrophosphatase [Frankiaceae bacterium]|nr:ADP-ribose pyrophosphatase [Frankiaceae bacterium]
MIHRLSGREVYRNQWLALREDTVQRADGSRGIYSVVDKPPMAIVLPIDDDPVEGRGVWLVEQYRYTLGRRMWELPQGAYESGPQIAPEELARQELREETGLRAGTVERLAGTMYVAYGFCSQEMHAFAATDLTPGEPDRETTEQDMVVGRFGIERFEDMLRTGEIADSLTHATYGLWLMRQQRSGC